MVRVTITPEHIRLGQLVQMKGLLLHVSGNPVALALKDAYKVDGEVLAYCGRWEIEGESKVYELPDEARVWLEAWQNNEYRVGGLANEAHGPCQPTTFEVTKRVY